MLGVWFFSRSDLDRGVGSKGFSTDFMVYCNYYSMETAQCHHRVSLFLVNRETAYQRGSDRLSQQNKTIRDAIKSQIHGTEKRCKELRKDQKNVKVCEYFVD